MYAIKVTTEVSKSFGEKATFTFETFSSHKTLKDARPCAFRIENQLKENGFIRRSATYSRSEHRIFLVKRDGSEVTFKTITISK